MQPRKSFRTNLYCVFHLEDLTVGKLLLNQHSPLEQDLVIWNIDVISVHWPLHEIHS